MGNLVAYIALLIWPVVTAVLMLRLGPSRGLIAAVLGGYLLLPPVTAINLPGVPAFDKMSIPALSAWGVAVFVLRLKVPLWPEGWVGRALLALFVLAPFGTVLTNAEPIAQTARAPLPGLRLYDAISIIVNQAFMILTFALARRFLRSAEALRDIVFALLVAGLVYSVPMLIEVRLSPQINVWFYGFFQHAFDQMMRQGGFRPIVFLEHGLWVAFFAMTAVLAAAAWLRSSAAAQLTEGHNVSGASGRMRQPRNWVVLLYLLLVLFLCKSVAALVYALVLLPLVLFASPRNMLRLALLMAVAALAYPVLRANGLVPVEQILNAAAKFSADRAQSLGYRFEMEGILLGHALERPVFGWGGYGRNLLHSPFDGTIVTVSDGRWIIVVSMFGWAGFIGEFGLLALPLALLARAARYGPLGPVDTIIGALALIHGINMVDLLPNATLTPVTWLICGALLGYAETCRPRTDRAQPEAPILRPILRG